MEQPNARLTYLNGRGRGELIRYMLGAAGLTFCETFLSGPQDLRILRESGKLLYNQVPLLEIDGMFITQTEAIIRYIARNYDLYGSTEADRVRCDMIFDGLRDSEIGVSGIKYIFCSDEDKEKLKEHMVEKMKKYFPMFERLLGKKKYFLGDNLSFPDVVLLHDLEWLTDIHGEEILQHYACLSAFRKRMLNNPNIAAFISSPQKKPFPDAEYVKIVRKVFH